MRQAKIATAADFAHGDLTRYSFDGFDHVNLTLQLAQRRWPAARMATDRPIQANAAYDVQTGQVRLN